MGLLPVMPTSGIRDKDKRDGEQGAAEIVTAAPISPISRQADIYLQAGIVTLVIISATLAAVLPSETNGVIISGDALIGLYSATLGYIFGYVPGAVARRNGG